MRRALLAGACMVVFTHTARADFPVIDLVSTAQEAKTYLVEAEQYAKQGAQYVLQGQQFETETTQLLAFVHNPNLGSAMALLNAAGLGSSLPNAPAAVMALIQGVNYGPGGIAEIQGILSVLSGLAQQSYAANHVYSPTDGTWASQQLITRGNQIAGEQGAAMAGYNDLQLHEAALQALRDRLATATTPKDVQDTQAQIELEAVWTNNAAAKLSAVQAAYQAQRDSREQQLSEQTTKSLDNQIQQALAVGNQ